VKTRMRIHGLVLAAMLFVATSSLAQVDLAGFTVSGSGDASVGYTAGYGDTVDSSHGLTASGTGAFTGYYFNPRFLSFNLQPYYDQSRANSAASSVDNSSGFNFSTAIFGGSHFPGFVNYSRSFNSTGTFGGAGTTDLTTHGNTQGFGVGWGANIPGLPTVSAQFQDNSSSYSIFGSNADGTSDTKSFSVRASDQRMGFSLSGGYSHSISGGDTPLLLSTGGNISTETLSNSYTFTVAHSLPLRGSISGNASHSSYDFSSSGSVGGSQAVNNYTVNASMHPFERFSFSGSATYNDNLAATITQASLVAGVPQVINQPGSNAVTLEGDVDYAATEHLSLTGQVERRQQEWFNASFGADSVRGGARYNQLLFGGSLGVASQVSESTQDNLSGYSLGFSDSVNFSRRIAGWNVSANGNYNQNQATLLIAYATSSYGVSGSVGRKFGKLNWAGSAGTDRTALTSQRGSTSASDSFATSLNTRRWFALSASYQHSTGTGLQTINGVSGTLPAPVPILAQSLVVLFGGHTYAFSASTGAIRHLTASASLSKSFSDTTGETVFSSNHLDQLVVTTQYQFRKMNFIGGYSRFLQSVSVAGTPASRLSSFYIGINRWFNFF
jgi:hypothetical protein